MSKALFRLTESLQSKPMLTTQSHLDNVLSYLTDRNSGVLELKIDVNNKNKPYREDVSYNEDTKVGVISIDGSLTYLRYEGICGDAGVSYKSIQSEFDKMVELGAKVVILDQDSNGGEAYMAFETASRLRSKADENGIKLISYTDGVSYSASYVFSSMCHEVIVNPMASVGSIGVVGSIVNVNKLEKSRGIERTYITAGRGKVPFTADGEWDSEFLNKLQDDVNGIYELFLNHVTQYRGLSSETVVDMGASTFTGADAVSNGLADKVMTHEEFYDYIASIREEDNMALLPFLNKSTKVSAEGDENTMITLEEMQEVLALKEEELTKAEASFVELQSQADSLQEQLTATLAELGEVKAKMAGEASSKRKERLQAVVGEDKVDGMFTALESLSDEAFATVLTNLEVQKAAMVDSFAEIGASENAATVVVASEAENKTLELAKKTYGVA